MIYHVTRPRVSLCHFDTSTSVSTRVPCPLMSCLQFTMFRLFLQTTLHTLKPSDEIIKNWGTGDYMSIKCVRVSFIFFILNFVDIKVWIFVVAINKGTLEILIYFWQVYIQVILTLICIQRQEKVSYIDP